MKREEKRMQLEILNFWRENAPGSQTRKDFFEFMARRDISRSTVYRNMQAIQSIHKIPLWGWYKCITDYKNQEGAIIKKIEL